MFVSIWGIFVTWELDNHAPYETALLATRIADISAIFIAPTWLHFILTYIGENEQKERKLIKFLYAYSSIIACFGFTPWFVPRLKSMIGFVHYVHPGLVFHFFTIEFFIIVVYGFVKLIKGLRGQRGNKRLQTLAILWGAFFGFFGGGICFAPVYDLPAPMYALWLMPLYPFIMAYAMVRHGLLDQEEILALEREKLVLLGLISSSINHEIKNPLFIMQELARKAESNLKENGVNGEARTAVEKIGGQLVRVKKIVDRLTEFGRPDSNPGSIEDVFLDKVIENCLFFASQEFKHLTVEVEIRIDESAKIVRGSRNQFEQILLNLIMNAFYAMPKGGKLTITARPIIASGAKQSTVEIIVSDTGTGIQKSDLKTIFKPFYTTKRETGTGLGLHIVKTLVEQNGGKISVESEIGKGTEFILRFPITIGISK